MGWSRAVGDPMLFRNERVAGSRILETALPALDKVELVNVERLSLVPEPSPCPFGVHKVSRNVNGARFAGSTKETATPGLLSNLVQLWVELAIIQRGTGLGL